VHRCGEVIEVAHAALVGRRDLAVEHDPPAELGGCYRVARPVIGSECYLLSV
jgi:hypothetical protein